jgi:hypothetical protein
MKKALIFVAMMALVLWGVSGSVFADDPPPTTADTYGYASQQVNANHGNEATGGWAEGGSDGYYKSVAYGDGDPTASGEATADGSLSAGSIMLPFGPGPKHYASSHNDLNVGSTGSASADPSEWVKVDVSGGAAQGNWATVGPNTYLFGTTYGTAGNKTQAEYSDDAAGDVNSLSTSGLASAYGNSMVSNDAVEPDDAEKGGKPNYHVDFNTCGGSSSSNENVAGNGASSASGEGSGSGTTTGALFGVSGAASGGGNAAYQAAGANSAYGDLCVTGSFSTEVSLGNVENSASVSSNSSSSSN